MTNTERLIANLNAATKAGIPHIDFTVGKYTGNGTSVVNALRRRGFKVTRNSTPGSYKLQAATTGAAA